ncbi:endonuclease NucS domain-containing protein [Crateriforma conspicua]|uniref:endonuclease NucS domain-containing protein n=1 Tax=Crateriforma conspicua TaxID=2527996 RepID=UPI0011A48B59|nr:endonuclease NucS domain-containing protein [Crateriforma conspicua]
MAIYDKPVRLLMHDMASEFALQPGEAFTRQRALDWFAEHYPKIKQGTITAHLIRLSTNAQSRLHYSAKPGDDDLFFQIDSGHYRLYSTESDPAPICTVNGRKPTLPTGEDESEIQPSNEFAYERDLRNYLSKNLSIIEAGLTLYEEEGINGIEFPVGGRYIDILAVDHTNSYVVIELKVSRGYDRVVGQLMRYMAWIKKNQADSGQRVRGIIIARDISEDLLLACSLLDDIQLFEYELSLVLSEVGKEHGE